MSAESVWFGAIPFAALALSLSKACWAWRLRRPDLTESFERAERDF